MKLFQPIKVRGVEFRNRIIMAPMGTLFGPRTTKSRDYYVERAKGGVGSIIIGGFAMDALLIPGFTQDARNILTEPVHQHGAKIAPQLFYTNRYPTFGAEGGGPEWVAPSAGRPLGCRPLAEVFYQNPDT